MNATHPDYREDGRWSRYSLQPGDLLMRPTTVNMNDHRSSSPEDFRDDPAPEVVPNRMLDTIEPLPRPAPAPAGARDNVESLRGCQRFIRPVHVCSGNGIAIHPSPTMNNPRR